MAKGARKFSQKVIKRCAKGDQKVRGNLSLHAIGHDCIWMAKGAQKVIRATYTFWMKNNVFTGDGEYDDEIFS